MSSGSEVVDVLQKAITAAQAIKARDDEIARLSDALEAKDKRIAELESLVKMGDAVVMDFMPNIGRCALQDYGRLNEFLIKAAKLQEQSDAG